MSSYLRVARIVAGRPVVQVIEVADTVDAVQLLERDPSLPGGVRTVRFVRQDGWLVRQESNRGEDWPATMPRVRRIARWAVRAAIGIWTGLDSGWRPIRGFVADYPFPAVCFLAALVLAMAAR